jgi:hypothetical protein
MITKKQLCFNCGSIPRLVITDFDGITKEVCKQCFDKFQKENNQKKDESLKTIDNVIKKIKETDAKEDVNK